MRVLGTSILTAFIEKHRDAENAIKSWLHEVRDCSWGNTHDIKNRYRSADFLANNRVIFNIKGNKYRLVVKIRFAGNVVLVEWVGTHAEYSKKRF